MKSCLIIASAPISDYEALKPYLEGHQLLICADGGIRHAKMLHVTPDLIVGDFDSSAYPGENTIPVLYHKPEKDDPDTMLAVREAIRRGYEAITILGALGGRMDHTLGNIAAMKYAAEKDVHAVLADHQNEMFFHPRKKISLKKRPGCYLSLAAYSEKVTGVTITGVKYPLHNAVLQNSIPLGISNEWTEEIAEISIETGDLLIIITKD